MKTKVRKSEKGKVSKERLKRQSKKQPKDKRSY